MLNNVKTYGCASAASSSGPSRILFFSDEKNFTVSEAYNRRNARYVSFDGDTPAYNVRYATSTKHPASLMFLGVVASTGEVSPPIWFKKKERLTAAKYIEILDKKLLPWMVKVAEDHPVGPGGGPSPFTFQQDGAPAHTAKATQDLLRERLGHRGFWTKNMWPPNSPDLNPLDYSIWNEVASKACSKPHSSAEMLKSIVNRVWSDLDAAYLLGTCQNFRKRLEKVIAVDGGYIE